MKRFIAFVRKEFLHIFRDKRTMLILIIMPVVLVVLFGFAVTTEVKDTKTAVYDPSKDAVTTQLIEKIKANKYFTVEEYLTSPAEFENVFKRGDINLIIAFSDDFAENMRRGGEASVQLLADGTEPNQASIRTGYAQSILIEYLQEYMDNGAGNVPLQITPEIRMLYNPQQKSEFNFVPGVIGMIVLLICAMMSSVAIVREKEIGTMEVLLASPIPPVCIILAKLVPYFVISLINLASILLLSVFLIDVPIAGSLISIMGLSLLYILVALSLGLVISTVVKSQLAAMLVSGMVLMLPTILLSGIIFPIESMPQWLQWISAILPARWFVDGIRRLMIQGVDAIYVAHDFIILSGMLVVLLAVSVKKFNIRLE